MGRVHHIWVSKRRSFSNTVKFIIDTLIHGYALHDIYGWSLHFLEALWSSVTHLLLHLGKREKKDETPTSTVPEATNIDEEKGEYDADERNKTFYELNTYLSKEGS